MPRIPVPDDLGAVQVQPISAAVASTPNLPSEMFGLALGQMALKSADTLGAIAIADQKEANDDLLRENKLRYETAREVERAAVNRSVGKEAIPAAQASYENLEKLGDEILDKNFTNDFQRGEFEAYLKQAKNEQYRHVEGHVSAQLDLHRKGTLKGLEENAALAVASQVRSSADVAIVAEKVRLIEPEIEKVYHGQPDALVQAAKDEAKGKLWAGALSAILETKAPGAARDAEALWKVDVAARTRGEPSRFGPFVTQVEKALNTALKYERPYEAVQRSATYFSDGRLDINTTRAKLKEATRTMPAEEAMTARNIFRDEQLDAADTAKQGTGNIINQAKAAWENGDPSRGIPPYTDPNRSVPMVLQLALRDPSRDGGPDGWHTILGWHSQFIQTGRTLAQLPNESQLRTYGNVSIDMIRNRAIYEAMPVDTFLAMWTSIDPVTREPRVTYPQMRELLTQLNAVAKKEAGPQKQIVSDGEILLKALEDNGFMPTGTRGGRGGYGVKPLDPTTWAKDSREAAAWIHFSSQLQKWKTRNPDAGDQETREWIQKFIGDEKLKMVGRIGKLSAFREDLYLWEIPYRKDIDPETIAPYTGPQAGPAAPPSPPAIPAGSGQPAAPKVTLPPPAAKPAKVQSQTEIPDDDLALLMARWQTSKTGQDANRPPSADELVRAYNNLAQARREGKAP